LKRKLILYLSAAAVLLALLALYVGVNARRELDAARGILGTSVGDLSSADILAAREHLEAADGWLSGPPAAILRLMPVARQNIQAADTIVDAGLPVLVDADSLTAARDALEAEDLVRNGRIKLEALETLSEPLGDQLDALRHLEAELKNNRSGWLLPPVWDAVDDLARRVEDLRQTAEEAEMALEILRPLLGEHGRRTYLVILLNNAELRGAGGLLSAVGTISVEDGRVQLGQFFYHGDIGAKPHEVVPAPADFERRFGRYRANSTRWVNTSVSPDVPEVATVAARLFERVRNVRADGALLIDPRGISSLVPAGAEIPVPGTDRTLSSEDFTDFVYSDSYELLGGQDPRRKAAILSVGQAAFRTFLAEGGGTGVLDKGGDAISAGHIRFVSFDAAEQMILDRLGVTGSLSTDAVDNLLVTVQNLGADKLDYWMRRGIAHKCQILSGEFARCETVVQLTNGTPVGLDNYVSQANSKEKRGHSYGAYLGYLEVYVPETAELTGVTLDGRVASFFPEVEDGRKSLGMNFSTDRGKTTTARVSYELGLPGEGYSLEIMPQPLTSDAEVEVAVRGPESWQTSGPGTANEGRIDFQGNLDGPLQIAVRPAARTGITALWRNLVHFWTRPLGS